MGGFAVSSMYQAPGMREIAEQKVAELQVHPDAGAMFKVGVQLAKGFPIVTVGDILGMITAGPNAGKYRRYTKSVAATAQLTGDSTITLKDLVASGVASPFIAGDIVNVGGQNTKTITAVDQVNGTITIAGTFGGSISIGDSIVLTTADGSEVAACIAARPIWPMFYDPSNPNNTPYLDQDYLVDAFWQGIVKRSVVRGLTSAAMTDLAAISLQPYMDALMVR